MITLTNNNNSKIDFNRLAIAVLSGVAVAGMLSGCGRLGSESKQFAQSGSLIISRTVPEAPLQVGSITESNIPLSDIGTTSTRLASTESPAVTTPIPMAPLIGFIPPAIGSIPPENDTWLAVDKANGNLSLMRGNEVIRKVRGEGEVPLTPGTYALQLKTRDPVWYAPDQYFTKRNLTVPTDANSKDDTRYLRGALGKVALFPTPGFAIHSSPLFSEEVGGLRVQEDELKAVFDDLPLGASIVVR